MPTQRIKGWIRFGLIGCLFLGTSQTYARDLQGRLGLGYNSQFANSYASGYRLPGVSVKYALTRDLGFEGILAIATTSPSNTVTAGKVFKTLFFEPNLNFYSMGGLGFVGANGQSGIQILAGLGLEFFFPGLDSLGFSMEVGGSLDNSTGSYALKTMGFSFLDAGMHFYF